MNVVEQALVCWLVFTTLACTQFVKTEGTEYTERYPEYECPPENTTCTYYFTIKETLTMIMKKDLVYPVSGKLYKYDEGPSTPNATQIPIDKVVTVDGYNRMAITVNGVIPGPPIIVYEGQTVVVHVHNLLLSDSVTIHWHGLHMKDTPWMDGVGWVSQCPIGAGQTFTYEFKASPKGTFWYHSHVGAQRSNGLFGALIIKEKPENVKEQHEEKIMVIGDWHHESSEEVYIKMIYGNFKGRIPFKTTKTLDGGRFSGVPWVSALINGKGRYRNPDNNETIPAPLERFKVKPNQTYRFRVIQAGTIYPLRVSVDRHTLTVVASDGYDLAPVQCESFIINPGERFDFLLTTNQTIENYWIRIVSMEANVEHHSEKAILHYEGANTDDEPNTDRQNCPQSECTVVNCPFTYFPTEMNIKCVLMSDLTSPDSSDPAPEFIENDSKEHFLNFAFPGESVTPGSVNGRKFEFPGVNSLTQNEQIGKYDCDRHECGHDKICYCHYQLEIPSDKTIQMIWMNVGKGAGWGHPMHLHGHSFYVLKMSYPPQNQTSGKLATISDMENELFNKDVDCGGGKQFCNEAKWRNSSWTNGNIPGLNLVNPPRKDTLIIPTGAYAVIRIRSNNPGKWFLHCHIEVHSLDGMAMLINEGVDKQKTPPHGFPVCQNFYNDRERDVKYVPHKESEVCAENQSLLIVCIVLAVIVIVLLTALIVIKCSQRARVQDSKENLRMS
eukprot:TCONS_00000475-protein